jgi:hypothetical protein
VRTLIQKLLDSITDGLFVHKRVYSISYLLETFRSFLPPQQGQGASNLVYSSSVSMVEAIQTAHRLKVEKDSMKLETSIVND